MTIKLEVAYGIIEAITDLRKGDDLEDFTVIVNGISVRCHRFILGACSLFFRALFRSGMKEDEENCATLETVSHSTFTLILTALYTGCDIVTEENVIDVWRAAHMLQIGFLVHECEKYIEHNISIDNFEKFYETAKLLDSETILNAEHKLMTTNFDLIRTSQTLLKLSYSEIKALIETDDLVTTTEDNVVESVLQWVSYTPPQTSEHDADAEVNHVMEGLAVQSEHKDQENQLKKSELSEEESVNITFDNNGRETNEVVDESDELHNTSDEGARATENVQQNTENQNLVQNKMIPANGAVIQTLTSVHKQTQTSMLPVERQQHLLSLMTSARCCLLSPEYLGNLLSNPIIADNPEVRSIVFKAVDYQLQTGHRHGQWPSAAIHRRNSHLTNVLIWASLNENDTNRSSKIHARAYFSKDRKLYMTTMASSGKLTAFDNELYELNEEGLHVFRDDSWSKITDVDLSEDAFMIPSGNYIYFLDGNTKELKALNPKEKLSAMQDQPAFPGESSVTGTSKFHDRILVFSPHANEENELETATAVHCFSPSKKSWERLENLKGPANSLVSFHNDDNTFLLQTDGNLWKVTDDKNGLVKIVFCMKAWDFHWKLYGAAMFREELVIYGEEFPEGKHVSFFIPFSNVKAKAWTVKRNICTTPIILPSKYLKKIE